MNTQPNTTDNASATAEDRANINLEAKRSFKAPKSIARNDRDVMTVTLKAYRLNGNFHPHFSATASSLDCGGCLHDEILQVWPEAKPIIDLHLSNADDGVPMHAEADGYYWLAGAVGGLGETYHGGSGQDGKSVNECLRILADHLRVTLDEAERIANVVGEAYNKAFAEYEAPPTGSTLNRLDPFTGERRKTATNTAKNVFHDYVNAQRDRWEKEAAEGLELIKKLAND